MDKEEKKANGIVANLVGKWASKHDKAIVSKEDIEHLQAYRKSGKHKRFFEGGSYSPTKSFSGMVSSQPFDWLTYDGLLKLRESSRNLAQNNPIAKKYFEMCETNIVGAKGFDVQIMGQDSNGQLDIAGNKAVKDSWIKWCNSNWCDITGKLSFSEIERVVVRAVSQDGETLTKMIRNKATKENPWGFSLQLLDSARLDIRYNSTINNNSMIKMSVELNEYGRPVAYYLRKSDKTESVYVANYEALPRERVSAEDILHPFETLAPEQTRGIPWIHSVISIIEDLDDFIRACLTAAKLGASSAIFFEQDFSHNANSIDGIADSQDEYNFNLDISPGDIRVLPPGLKMSSFKGEYPMATFTPYIQSMLKMIASGLGVTYFTLANSLESVNYTSSRTGLLEERENWIKKQDFFITKFILPVYLAWLETSLLNGAIKFPNGMTMSPTKFDKFSNVKIVGKRWPWVDPLKDGQADILGIKNGLISRTQALAQRGIDYEQVLLDRKQEIELEKRHGISFDMTDLKGGLDIPLGSEDAEDGSNNASPEKVEMDPTAHTEERP